MEILAGVYFSVLGCMLFVFFEKCRRVKVKSDIIPIPFVVSWHIKMSADLRYKTAISISVFLVVYCFSMAIWAFCSY